jgi:hypothetical protein
MRKKRNNRGFSLAEILLAVGTLAVGMIFVAGVFPVGILFTTVATERTVAAVVADEAFAKMRIIAGSPHPEIPDRPLLFAGDFPLLGSMPFEEAAAIAGVVLDPQVFAYPSIDEIDVTQKRYFWSAVCRRTEADPNSSRSVQVTVFVCRRTGGGLDRPVPAQVGVSAGVVSNMLTVVNEGEETFVNDGHLIVDNETGYLYRVLKRIPIEGAGDELALEQSWRGPSVPMSIWVVPPPVGGGRYPCIAVYQKVVRF